MAREDEAVVSVTGATLATVATVGVVRSAPSEPRIDARTNTAATRAAIELFPAARRHVPRWRKRMTSIVPLTREKRKYAQAIQAMVASALGQKSSGICDPAAECNCAVVGRWCGNGQPTTRTSAKGIPTS